MQTIKLSLEIPAKFLREWTPLTDLDFVLAHRVLEDADYRTFYLNRKMGRELILDNSMHELGRPLPVADLRRAARLVDADFIVAPDELRQPARNLRWFADTQVAFARERTSLAAVMCGRTAEEREDYLLNIVPAAMFMMPYREDRLSWYLEHEAFIRTYWSRIHLLGVSELDELAAFASIAKRSEGMSWSVDTAKPFKHGLANRKMDDGTTLRGASLSSKDLLGISEITDSQAYLIEHNIHVLRGILA